MHQRVHRRAVKDHKDYIPMDKRNDDVKKIVRIFLDELGKQYKIDQAYIFGSHAKGTSNYWSDIDIAVISSDFSEDLYKERLALMKLAVSIDDRIEPRPFDRESFDENDPLVEEIQKYGIQLVWSHLKASHNYDKLITLVKQEKRFNPG